MYPDCPSTRGQRHIRELIRHIKNDGDSSLIFIAALPDVKAFVPYREGDPIIYRLIHQAYNEGVNLKALQISYSVDESNIILMNSNLPIKLPDLIGVD